MLTRRLTLRREELTALTTEEMSRLAAGNGGPEPTPPIWAPRSVHLQDCVATTQDSMLVCTVNCASHAATCTC